MHISTDLNHAVRKFWEFEAIGIKNNNYEVCTQAENAMAKAAESQRKVDAHYKVEIVWIQEEIALENNCLLAQTRMENLERSLQLAQTRGC